MTGYVRKDTTNNIADGNVINAADLDSEFDGVQAAFNSSTGHTHDGTASEGAPITKLGPVQDVTISTTVLGVKTTNTVDLGTSSLKFKDFYLAGAASIGGTLGVTGATTLSAALTYGGVTLSNAVTGTGNMVLSASPTLTGTITAAAANFSGAVALNGNTTIGDADTDTITQAASYVTGTQLKSAKTATNTLSLAAYDVDGTAYTNLITLTASNTPTLALTSTGVGSMDNIAIGATTASTGAFTTLTSNGATTFTAGTASTTTGTGTLVITGGLGVSGRINAANFDGIVGANTAAAGSFTTLTTSSTVTHNGGTANGVAYLNGSKVLTTGSALVFDGTNLGVGVTPSAWQSGFKAIQLSGLACWNVDGAVAGSATYFGNNVYRDSVDSRWEYLVSGDNATQYLQASGSHIWRTAASGTAGNAITFTQAMTLDASGNLGIGTTSPAYKLDVTGAINATNTSNTTVATGGFDASTSWSLKVANASTTAGTGAGIFFLGGTNSESWIGNLYESSGVGALSFQTRVSGTRAERMRIDSSGNLLVGTTAAVLSGKLTTNFTGNTINGATFNDTGNGNGAGFIIFAESGTAIGSISRVGTTSAVAYNTTSDYRLKTVTGAVTGQGSRIDALKPIDYLWKDGGQQARGFLAHEFQTVYPNSVTGTKDAVDADGNPKHQSMQASSSEVIADLVAEIQSLRTRITALESA